jgi:peptidoglycan hydrolase CwlO-like protein
MKTIKKYWTVIVGVILAIIAAIFVSDKLNKKKIEKTDKQLDDNNQQLDQIQGKTEVIEEQREEVKQEIQETKSEIEELQTAKEELHVEEKPVEEAKQNILNKTRRGRPKKQ